MLHFYRLFSLILVLSPFLCYGQEQQASVLDSMINECRKQDTQNYISCLNSLSQQYNTPDETMTLLYYKASHYISSKETDSAVWYGNKGLEIARQENNTGNQQAFKSIIAVAYSQAGDYPKAIKGYIDVISISEQNGDSVSAAIIKTNVANMYIKQNDYNNAKLLLNEAYHIFSTRNKNKNAAGTLGMIAFVNYKLGDTATATNQAQEAMHLSIVNKNIEAQAKAAGVLAGIYVDKKHYDSAIYYYQLTKELGEAVGEKYHVFMAMSGLMNSYYLLKQYGKANNIAEQLAKDIENKNSPYAKIKFYTTYSNILAATGAYKRALAYQKKAYALNKKITKTENSKVLNEVHTKYETEKKDRQIAENKLVMQEQANKISKRNLYLALLLLAVTILTLAVVMIRMRSKRKIEQINEQKRLQVLNAHINGEEKERKRIAKELHDGIANELAVIKMGIENTTLDIKNEQLASQLKALADTAQKTHRETRRISHNLNPAPSLKNKFADAVKEYLEGMPTTTAQIEVNVIKQADIRLSHEKQLLIFRTMQELVGNALKHSHAQLIEVNLVITDEHINITVSDDGDGMSTDILNNELTLSSVKENATILDGLIDIDSTLHEGTSVLVSILNKK